jgi:hypothetical protein
MQVVDNCQRAEGPQISGRPLDASGEIFLLTGTVLLLYHMPGQGLPHRRGFEGSFTWLSWRAADRGGRPA